MYPQIEINTKKLIHNAKEMLNLCQANNITHCFLVSKVLAGNKKLVRLIAPLGFTHIADSRLKNLKQFQDIALPKVLLRSPCKDEIKDVITLTDCSLASEFNILVALNEEAKKQQKTHQIILMFDLGDLREGIFYLDPYLETIEKILNLEKIKLIGIGTNLTCYGGVIPTKEHFNQLINIKTNIEAHFPVKLELISAGNTSLIYLLDGTIPKEINSIRIGEAIYIGKETSFQKPIKNMVQDIFLLKGELIEVKEKPSYPIGQIGLDSFGRKPQIKNEGLMKRGIIAIGKQDVFFDNIIPLDKAVKILGGSSDHLLVNLTNTTYKLGDVLTFSITYAGLLQLMTSPYVFKKYI